MRTRKRATWKSSAGLAGALLLTSLVVACDDTGPSGVRQKVGVLESKVSELQRELSAARAREATLLRNTRNIEKRVAALSEELLAQKRTMDSRIEEGENRTATLVTEIAKFREIARNAQHHGERTLAEMRRQATVLRGVSVQARSANTSIQQLSESLSGTLRKFDSALGQQRTTLVQTTRLARKIRADFAALESRLKSLQAALPSVVARIGEVERSTEEQASAAKQLADRYGARQKAIDSSIAVLEAKVGILFTELRNLRRRQTRAPASDR